MEERYIPRALPWALLYKPHPGLWKIAQGGTLGYRPKQNCSPPKEMGKPVSVPPHIPLSENVQSVIISTGRLAE